MLLIKYSSTKRNRSNGVVVHPPIDYKPPKSRIPVRIAIVSMTKNPLAFRTWLLHHREIGVEHFFLRVEDTPKLKTMLTKKPWSQCTTVTYAQGEQSYFTQMDRQDKHVNLSTKHAREMGYTHLMHIDDDELIYCAAGPDAFRQYLGSTKADCIKMKNIEAVYDRSECDNPFKTTLFCTRPSMYTAYVNGKSIGALRCPTLKMNGPHDFTGNVDHIPSFVAVVAHYESSCIERWRKKFLAYATGSPRACKMGKIPFSFYCESMRSASGEISNQIWEKWKTAARHKGNLVSLQILRI